jgi:hypothetical protein
MSIQVIDPGPIAFADLVRFVDEADTETALERLGHEPETTTYRLVEIAVADFADVKTFPLPGHPDWMLAQLHSPGGLPPIIVEPISEEPVLLIDGYNRLFTHWLDGRRTISAYELLSTTPS